MTTNIESSESPSRGTLRKALGYLGLGLGLTLLLLYLWIWLVWPPPVWYRWVWPRETAFMAMRRHEMAAEKRPHHPSYQPVPLEALAKSLPAAVMAGEDQRFAEHSGMDFVELRKALGYRSDRFSWTSARDRRELLDAIGKARRRPDDLRGASTITQQLAKNLYLTSSRNPLRKVKEALLAWRLEYWLGKDRIMALYLNVAEFGPGIWGAEAASRAYFRKSAGALSVEESAALAGTLPFPLRSNPGYRPGRMRWRQNMILRWLRGEPVEIPPAPDIPIDTVPAIPDTLLVPDTIPAKPDSGGISRPDGAASPG